MNLYYAGHADEAWEQFRVTLEMDPDFCAAHYALQLVYNGEGMYGDAVDGLEHIFLRMGATEEDIAAMRDAFETSGIEGVYRWSIGMWTRLSEHKYVDPYNFAVNYAALGDKDKAFEWLEKAYEQSSFLSIVWIRIDSRFESLRSDPRYPELLKKIGIDE